MGQQKDQCFLTASRSNEDHVNKEAGYIKMHPA
jgi:hypothetical protein